MRWGRNTKVLISADVLDHNRSCCDGVVVYSGMKFVGMEISLLSPQEWIFQVMSAKSNSRLKVSGLPRAGYCSDWMKGRTYGDRICI